MTVNDNDRLGAVIARLDKLAPLSTKSKATLAALPFTLETAGPDEHLVREGELATHCCILVTGYACRYKMSHGGARQIVSFHHPGDLLDLQHLLVPVADHSLQVLSRATYLKVPSAALKKAAMDHPDIAQAFWRDTLIDASILREGVLNVGRRDAKSRIAHMLCEFAVRGKAAGLCGPESMEFPLTQEHIADATGLTNVHVNRTLRVLREDGVLSRNRRYMFIADWKRLQDEAKFNPRYLHLAA